MSVKRFFGGQHVFVYEEDDADRRRGKPGVITRTPCPGTRENYAIVRVYDRRFRPESIRSVPFRLMD